jgi:hypothetical protein
MRRVKASPAAATARPLGRRRYALIRVHPLLYRYQTFVSDITFLFLSSVIKPRKCPANTP